MRNSRERSLPGTFSPSSACLSEKKEIRMQQNVDLAQAAAASSAFLSQSLREEIQLSPPLLRKLSWLASRTKNLSKSSDFDLFDSFRISTYNFAANVSGHIQYTESRSCRMPMKFQNTHISHNAHDTFIKAV